jgi:hypothetical protein
MEHVMYLEHWKKTLTAVGVSGVLMLATVSAQAQSVSVGTNASVDLGDVKAAHASKGNAALKGANINVDAAEADGVRVGSNTFKSGVQGSVSVPAAIVLEALQ